MQDAPRMIKAKGFTAVIMKSAYAAVESDVATAKMFERILNYE